MTSLDLPTRHSEEPKKWVGYSVSRSKGRGPDVDLAEVLEMWVPRTGAGLKLTEIGGRMGRSVARVHGRLRTWARAMQESEELMDEATAVIVEALRQDYGGLPLGRHLPPGVFTRRAG